MTRPLRIDAAGACHHVTARGNDRGALYLDDHDRRRFLAVLGEAADRFRWSVLAYALLGNHYHLLLRTPDGRLSAGMRHLNGVYAQGFNARHERSGHVFEGRFRAVLVEQDRHLLEVVRYIAMNPVAAGLCRHPTAWPWASYAALTGDAPAPAFLDARLPLRMLTAVGETSVQALRRFVEGEPPGDVQPLGRGVVLGTPAFVGEAVLHRPLLPDVPRRHLRPLRPPLAAILPDDPGPDAIRAAQREHGYLLREIAAHLGVGRSTLCRRLAGTPTGRRPVGRRQT